MKGEQKKTVKKKAQTAIEYMLLLTICALIVFASFRTFFQPSGRVRNGLDLYFNKVSNEMMGEVPVLSTTAAVRACAENKTPAVCAFYGSRCSWVTRYSGGGCSASSSCEDGIVPNCQPDPGCECRCQPGGCPCSTNTDEGSCCATSGCAWQTRFWVEWDGGHRSDKCVTDSGLTCDRRGCDHDCCCCEAKNLPAVTCDIFN